MNFERRDDAPNYEPTQKPGDRLIHRKTRRSRLAVIERGVSTPLQDAYHMMAEIFTQTPVAWFLGALAVLVFVGPIPVWLFERTGANSEMDSYWVALWWGVSAFSTIGHSGVHVHTAGGQIVGSIYSVVSVALFFGAGISAFTSYFMVSWRKPKTQVVDTVNYYLQRLDDLSVEELRELDGLTRGLIGTALEDAIAADRDQEGPETVGANP